MSSKHGQWPDAAVDGLLNLIRPGQRTVLALDGPSGAGKSTLADQAVAALSEEATLVRMEDLYPGWDGLDAATHRLATEVLPPLLRGEPAEFPR